MSKTISEMLFERGEKRGELKTLRETLHILLEERFPQATAPELSDRINAEDDAARLQQWIRIVARATSPDDLKFNGENDQANDENHP